MLLANAMGISSRLVWMPPSAARLTRIGSISATVPVLLTNAPIPAVTSMVSTSRRSSLLPASFMILPPSILASPVRKMAPPTTKSPTIMTTMELEKPESACSGLKIPNTIRHSREHSATISERILPWTNKTADTPRMSSVVNMSINGRDEKSARENI